MERLMFIVIVLCIRICLCQLYEGDKCQLNNDGEDSGRCVYIDDCPWALEEIKNKSSPKICEFRKDNIYPVVCCPEIGIRSVPPALPPGNRSREKCEEYLGKKPPFKTLVFNGKQALSKEFPHMAILGYGRENENQWLCGGSLISRNFILTAAHCLYSQELGPVSRVRLGDLDIKDTKDDADPQDFTVVRTIIHPEYRAPAHYNDIGLIQLDQEARFTLYVKPACLYIEPEGPKSEMVATGWGKLEYLGELSSHLMKVDLSEVDFEQCKKRYENFVSRKLQYGILKESQLCAGSGEVNVTRDTCQGDSGGPLQVTMYDMWKLYYAIVGITSFGKPCGTLNDPGVYTRVSNYISWIEAIVWPN